jgi:hypothetical protein
VRRSKLLYNVVLFLCALERIHSHPDDVPASWHFGPMRIHTWSEFVAKRPVSNIWDLIRAFKQAIDTAGEAGTSENLEAARVALKHVWWSLLEEQTRAGFQTWDCVFERVIIACMIRPTSTRDVSYQLNTPSAMATCATHLSWLARAGAVSLLCAYLDNPSHEQHGTIDLDK